MNVEIFDRMFAALPQEVAALTPDIGIVLGSGWDDALVTDEVLARVFYSSIPGLGASTVKGHKGELVVYRRAGKLVAAWCGRRHYYEGIGWEPVVAPVEILRRLGTRQLLLTNAAGGINQHFLAGELMVITDHLNLSATNPLIGAHNPDWGERFPDMSEVYSSRLSVKLVTSCVDTHTLGRAGVYAFVSGPAYETPAEIRAFRALGADAVGMSTVPEAMFARACGFEVAALSLITNAAAGISSSPLDHEEVMRAGENAKAKLSSVIDAFLARL